MRQRSGSVSRTSAESTDGTGSPQIRAAVPWLTTAFGLASEPVTTKASTSWRRPVASASIRSPAPMNQPLRSRTQFPEPTALRTSRSVTPAAVNSVRVKTPSRDDAVTRTGPGRSEGTG
ncbi:hypothetical protein O2W20_04580 [Modestobacter sp. VKM Ac-2982]|nr:MULTISPECIES: hypothetical protein [unclassified Modestobacter]MCZ2823675.1 hypothetical protein [Modestobacter sp. VKM Ac-2981]MCZ2851920.1 hypothetical protein [Modestobacter sp. VKM Ac-2982]